MTPVRVVIGAGGTAGHVFPALATAAVLRDRLGADVRFVGRARGQEATLVPAAGFPLDTVEAVPFARRLSPAMLRAPLVALRAARRSRALVRGADAVLGMGGYVSVPVSLAARRERIPLVVHEQNAAPGLANRVAARWARVVALSFEDAGSRFSRRARTEVTGNPVREEIAHVPQDREALRRTALAELRLDAARRTVVVFGGSQGALRLNRAAVGAAALLADRSDVQLLLLTGRGHHEEIAGLVGGEPGPLRVMPFLERMELAYATADLVVCRAGATTVAEVTVCGVPAVFVPYPHATGRHQEANAAAVVRAGGAVVVPDEEATADAIAERVAAIIGNAPRLEAMAEGARSLGRPDAAEALAELTASVARGGAPR